MKTPDVPGIVVDAYRVLVDGEEVITILDFFTTGLYLPLAVNNTPFQGESLMKTFNTMGPLPDGEDKVVEAYRVLRSHEGRGLRPIRFRLSEVEGHRASSTSVCGLLQRERANATKLRMKDGTEVKVLVSYEKFRSILPAEPDVRFVPEGEAGERLDELLAAGNGGF